MDVRVSVTSELYNVVEGYVKSKELNRLINAIEIQTHSEIRNLL